MMYIITNVVKLLLTLFAVVAISACDNREGYIHPAFISYVEDFEETIGVKANYVDIVFAETPYPQLALCVRGSGKNVIKVNPVAWGNMSFYGKEQLIYHELGHCVLFREHNDSVVFKDGYALQGSIMNSYWFGETLQYKVYNEAYKKALRFDMSAAL